MKKEWEKVSIGDRQYSFEMIPAEGAVKLNLKIVEAFGGILSSLAPMFGDLGKEVDDIDGDKLGDVLMNAAGQVDAAKIMPVLEALVLCCFVITPENPKGYKCTMNDFNGRILELYKVCFYAARYNFADFFGASS